MHILEIKIQNFKATRMTSDCQPAIRPSYIKCMAQNFYKTKAISQVYDIVVPLKIYPLVHGVSLLSSFIT